MRALLAALVVAVSWPAAAQDSNIALPIADLERMLGSEPLQIVEAEISRPKMQSGVDITLKAEVSFAGRPPIRVKVRKAERGAQTFNNVPRYDLAAYELQKLLMDAAEYVVPPTSLRMLPLAEMKRYSPAVKATFGGADDVLCVVQYWLQAVTAQEDILVPARFESDALYARHIGQLNVFTYLINHRDSNLGNFLISTAPEGARVFSIDHGVAFFSEPSDRGELWRPMRVKRLPADTVARLRKLTEADLNSRLAVLAEWKLENGHYVAVSPGKNLRPKSGVRRDEGVVQMGLTAAEIGAVWSRAQKLLKMIDDGEIATY
ncbi:MAG TPA: hypothetical protein VJT80_23050 [Steroidobacteraceae bacterium]|nr:hypothetical protein [Steroidobacteraceae bacterium]